MKLKTVLLLVITIASRSQAMAQQIITSLPQAPQNRTDLFFNQNKPGSLNKRFDFLFPAGNRMILEFTLDSQVDSLPAIDSLVQIVWKDLMALGDTLASPLVSKRVDVVFSAAPERRIRMQSFPQQGNIYRIKDGDITQLKMEQDTLRLALYSIKATGVFYPVRPIYITFVINHFTDLPSLLKENEIAPAIQVFKKDFAARRFKNRSASFTQYHAIYDVPSQQRLLPKSGALNSYRRTTEFIPYAQTSIQYLRGSWVPSAGAGVELTTKERDNFETKFQLFWEPYFLFGRDSLKRLSTYRNDFITFRYSTFSSYRTATRQIEFRQAFSLGYLVRRSGGLFERNTFKFSWPGLQIKNILLEPETVFNDFFKHFSPSLKLTLILE